MNQGLVNGRRSSHLHPRPGVARSATTSRLADRALAQVADDRSAHAGRRRREQHRDHHQARRRQPAVAVHRLPDHATARSPIATATASSRCRSAPRATELLRVVGPTRSASCSTPSTRCSPMISARTVHGAAGSVSRRRSAEPLGDAHGLSRRPDRAAGEAFLRGGMEDADDSEGEVGRARDPLQGAVADATRRLGGCDRRAGEREKGRIPPALLPSCRSFVGGSASTPTGCSGRPAAGLTRTLDCPNPRPEKPTFAAQTRRQ